MRRINLKYTVWSFFFSVGLVNAQGIHAHHEVEKDTNILSHFFEKGRFYGHARLYMGFAAHFG